MKERFDHDCKTPEEAAAYLDARSKQLLRFGYRKIGITTTEWGAEMLSEKDGETFQSIYLTEGARGKGIYPGLVRHRILTSNMCGIEDYLAAKGIDHVSEDLNPQLEYYVISDHYGGKIAKRSGVQLMNHIDEGLAILEWIGASEVAKRAYCIHPIVQSDVDLYNNYGYGGILTPVRDPLVIIAAIEYRSVANEYLSTRSITNVDEIRLSPLKVVNDMLIADKIQNRKDFELYHEGTHPRSEELAQYFRNWLERLGISEEFYQETKSRLL